MNVRLKSSRFLGSVVLAVAPRLLLLLSALFLFGACSNWPPSGSSSSSSGPAAGGTLNAKPVIDDLSLPQSANANGGYYLIQGTISFHDDVGVSAVHVRVPAIGKTAVIPAGGEAKLENEPLNIQLSADIPLGGAGPTELDITVVDASGLESDPRRVTVVLQ